MLIFELQAKKLCLYNSTYLLKVLLPKILLKNITMKLKKT